ncbi:UDP-N-acetyl-2-amino-2-deoxyglucuronate dehydrogenase [Desulfuromusa kysingii]|uniref:UDP-N-acetyl-2-amino-2-deoxyglucuronate dehydrogenase n=1 Tax=Desulfuromusa kysingii TaxID=37625 RepID=A0A1H3YIP8_9BACT|nr:Gfo/Idh/MocA family oxidoreductase [Desulfuromusa kysingii]SEA10792.1 UDP-N-acetyl-2-amino-2-deoxyglucuronate dehydrogenase [Desulfuromusa kysingii]
MENFALIGVGGYIAPRHMKAIKDTGNNLVAAVDKNDSVGIMDSYFPQANFFTEFERFDRHVEKLRRENSGKEVSYVSICSPNYLHDAHIRFALRTQANAVCEKPLVLNPWNIDALQEIEQESGKRVNTILQLRLHPSIIALKQSVEAQLKAEPGKMFDIDLTYLTSRGRWYQISWKGDEAKSGGVATNIGVHFFDMLAYIFGPVQKNICHIRNEDTSAGFLELKHARVRWFLSVNAEHLPSTAKENGQTTYRSITVDGHEIEFSGGFTDLHTRSYEGILAGKGFGLSDVHDCIQIVHDFRHLKPAGLTGDYHPFCGAVNR